MKKVVTYEMNVGDRLHRQLTLADLVDFVEGIVRDNLDSDPHDVRLRMDGFTATLVTTP